MGRLLAIAAVLSGCYSPPSPTCGFICGTGYSCPGGYTCNDEDHRCHLDGTTEHCEAYADADIPDASPYPMVISTTPEANAQGVIINAFVSATFNVPVGNVNSTTFSVVSDGTSLDGFTDVIAEQAVFEPHHLPSGKTVVATITPGITDEAGRSVPMYTWSFQVEVDTVAPTVIGTHPVDGEPQFSPGDQVGVQFSEDVQGTNGIEISSGGVAIPGSWFFDVEQGQYVAQFEPEMGLLPDSAVIDVVVPATITDYAGNPLVPFSMQFTTSDLAPFFEESAPFDMAINVPTDTKIVVTFSKPVTNVDSASFVVNGGLVTGTLASSVAGQVWTFTPDATLPAASMFTVDLTTAITDLVGTPVLAPTQFSFTTL
jgi:hypothetical protein